MEEQSRSVMWKAYEHPHDEKKSDWYWILWILTIASVIAAVLLGNTLLGILILVGAAIAAILAARPPKIVSYEVTQRGLRIEDTLYPYTTLEAFCIDGDCPKGPQLLVRSEKMFMPLLVLPLPEDTIDIIEDIIAQRIPESHIEEPFAHKLLDILKF